MKKEMLINVLQPEECRIAIVEDGVLEELYVERASQESYVGNIYKGKIVNIEPGIQAVFVDFGIGRNGFLHVTDVDPVYYKHLLPKELLEELEEAERDDSGRPASRGDRSGGGRPPRDDRRGRDDRRDRPRYTEAENVVSVTNASSTPAAASNYTPVSAVGGTADDETTLPTSPIATPPTFVPEDEAEFFIGLDDESPIPPRPTTPPAPVAARSAEPRPALPPMATVPTPAVKYVSDEEIEDFTAGLDFEQDAPSPRNPTQHPVEVEIADHEPEPNTTSHIHTPAKPPVVQYTPLDEFDWTIPDLDSPAPSPASNSAATPFPEVATGEEPTTFENTIDVVSVDAGDADDASDDKPSKTRGRARTPGKKPKAKTDEVGDAKPAEGEDKPKAKTRRVRKKTDGDDTADDDKPRPMESTERRTTDDDEPEIRPFFEGADDFDVEGPNDRFAGEPAEDSADTGFEPGETPEVEESTEPADEFEPYTAPSDRPRRDDDGGRGGRGRGGRDGGRGGRGGRGDRDRGPRSGGPGGGRGGPPLKAHTRHKGLPIPLIQDIFKRGQEVIVQVIKEGIGTKGPTLSTFVSIAGRYLVLMPSLNRVGVSRKIEDRDARHRLRDIMNKLNPPKGVGFIVRTAAVDQTEQELHSDLAYLLRLWQVVVRRIRKVAAPVEIYRESDMITRTIRDIFSKDIDTIWVDEEHAFAAASEFLQIVMPNYASRIRYHGAGGETEPLFHRYRIEDEISKINQKRLDLPGGGSIIIEQTEALVSIDVNSGNFRAENNAEETAFQMNLRAAKEIARQLRLRDLGGVIVNDFIDMRSESHRRKVEDALRDGLRRDRARTKILRISEFGLIEMTRQRMQPSLKKRVHNECPHCAGTGYVKTHETMGIEVMRFIHLAAHRVPQISVVQLIVQAEVAFHILNRKRREIAAIEANCGMEVHIHGAHGVSPDMLEAKCFDSNGTEVRLAVGPQPRALKAAPPPRQESADRGDRDRGDRGDRDRGDRGDRGGRYRHNDD